MREAARVSHDVRWDLFLWPTFLISAALLVLPQGLFVWNSLHRDVGLGRVSDALSVANYVRILTDPFYLNVVWVTCELSIMATGLGLLFAFPTAYVLARLRSVWVPRLIILLMLSMFVTVLIKILGITVLLSQQGLVNQALLWLGIVDAPLRMVSNQAGVVIGLVQYTLPLFVMLLFSVVQTIPEHLEEAAEIHGASRLSTFRRVLLPLAMPGIVASTLIAFNMCMGAFTSAILLGGGRVLTLPILIQQKIILDTDYAFGASLSTTLLVFVFLVNVLGGSFIARLYRRKDGGR